MPKKNAKSRRADAERAAENYVHETLNCVVSCRAVRTQWQSQDMFASDVIGKRKDGSCVYIQATAGQYSAVTARRRKLEKIPWMDSDVVQVVQLIQTENPANARKKDWWFRVHIYLLYVGGGHERRWHTLDKAIAVPKEWFKAFKNREAG